MKYIKMFERLNFKVGDYVYFDSNSTDEDGNIVIRKNYPYEIKTLKRRMIVGPLSYSATIICDDNEETIIDLDINAKKMSKIKAKIILNANKFNI